jgi:hypothetical protein
MKRVHRYSWLQGGKRSLSIQRQRSPDHSIKD